MFKWVWSVSIFKLKMFSRHRQTTTFPFLQAQCSALHSVSERGHTSLVQLLLEYNAHTDFQNHVSKHKLGGSGTLFQCEVW